MLQVVVLSLLARNVTPTQFGIASAALVVMGLTWVFTEAGVGKALVQRPDITERHVRVGFTFQVVVSVLLWLALWAGARVVADVFNIPKLAPVVPIITFGLVLNSLSLGGFLLQRDLDFRRVAAVQFVSWTLGYGVVAVVLALLGAGLWAIVVGNVTQILLRTIILWRVRPHAWRPLWDRVALAELLSFGGGYTLGWWANFAARQGDNFVVGRWLGAQQLGLYTRAYSLMRQPAALFGQVVSKVLFPALAAVQHDAPRLRRNYMRSVAAVILVVVPFTVIARVMSGEVITVLLGERWLAMQSTFDVLVVGMVLRTGYKLSDAVTTAAGAVYRRAWRQGVYATLVIGGAIVGQAWGITGVAVALLVALTTNYLLMGHLAIHVTAATWREWLGAHRLGLALGVVAWPPTVLVANVLRDADAPALITLTTGTVLAGLTCLLALRAAPLCTLTRPVADGLTDVLSVLGPRSAPRRAVTTLLGSAYAPPATPARRPAEQDVAA